MGFPGRGVDWGCVNALRTGWAVAGAAVLLLAAGGALALAIWFVATFVVIYFAPQLNDIVSMGFPFPFYMAAQGSLIIYVLVIWFYAHRMNQLDKEFGVHEGDEQ